jgi:hypothetical protein
MPYYRIRSQGTVPLRASRDLGIDKEDATLRKLSLGGTTATQSVIGTQRYVARTVQTIIAPKTNDSYAVFANQNITISGSMTVDSFNSADDSRSNGTVPYGTPGTTGQYSAMMGIYDANMGTNGTTVSIGSSTIYGSVSTNGGTVDGTGTVYGGIRTDAWQELAPVGAPDWYLSGTYSGNRDCSGIPVPTYNSKGKLTGTTTNYNVTSTTTITGGSEANPARYSIDYMKLAGTQDTLTFDWQRDNGNSRVANTNYIELYVLGDFTTSGVGSGAGSILITQDVHVKLYIGGDVKLVGNSINNGSGAAPYLTMYGVTPTDGSSKTWDFGGTTSFYGSVYAPSATVKNSGNSTFVGSVVANTVDFGGNANFIYDAALSGKGLVLGWKVRSWFEDTGVNGYTFLQQ